MSDAKTIELSNGDVVTLKEFCTRKIFKEIQKRMLGTTQIKAQAEGVQTSEIDVTGVNDAQDYAISAMIQKIVTSEKEEIKPSIGYVEDLRMEDYDLLSDAVNLITNPPKSEEEKKS